MCSMLWELNGEWMELVDREGNISEDDLESILLETIRSLKFCMCVFPLKTWIILDFVFKFSFS